MNIFMRCCITFIRVCVCVCERVGLFCLYSAAGSVCNRPRLFIYIRDSQDLLEVCHRQHRRLRSLLLLLLLFQQYYRCIYATLFCIYPFFVNLSNSVICFYPIFVIKSCFCFTGVSLLVKFLFVSRRAFDKIKALLYYLSVFCLFVFVENMLASSCIIRPFTSGNTINVVSTDRTKSVVSFEGERHCDVTLTLLLLIDFYFRFSFCSVSEYVTFFDLICCS